MAMTCSAPSPPDMLIDNLMIYWATETIGSSTRVYYDHRHFRAPFKATDHVRVPTAICMWPKDLVITPREWAERFYNVHQYSSQKRGATFQLGRRQMPMLTTSGYSRDL
jgi:hypothetical protein